MVSGTVLFNIHLVSYMNSFEILVTVLGNIENEILNYAIAKALFFNIFKENLLVLYGTGRGHVHKRSEAICR